MFSKTPFHKGSAWPETFRCRPCVPPSTQGGTRRHRVAASGHDGDQPHCSQAEGWRQKSDRCCTGKGSDTRCRAMTLSLLLCKAALDCAGDRLWCSIVIRSDDGTVRKTGRGYSTEDDLLGIRKQPEEYPVANWLYEEIVVILKPFNFITPWP